MQNYAPDKPTYVFFRKMLVALKRAGLTRRLGSDWLQRIVLCDMYLQVDVRHLDVRPQLWQQHVQESSGSVGAGWSDTWAGCDKESCSSRAWSEQWSPHPQSQFIIVTQPADGWKLRQFTAPIASSTVYRIHSYSRSTSDKGLSRADASTVCYTSIQNDCAWRISFATLPSRVQCRKGSRRRSTHHDCTRHTNQ